MALYRKFCCPDLCFIYEGKGYDLSEDQGLTVLLDFHEIRGKNYLQKAVGKPDFLEDRVSLTDFTYGGREPLLVREIFRG